MVHKVKGGVKRGCVHFDTPSRLFYLSSDTEYLTILTHRIFGDKTLKSHDIISDKTSKIKWKNTYKKQVCNQQEINWL